MVPQALGISLRNRIGDSTGEFLVVFLWGLLSAFNVLELILQREIPMAWGTTTDNLTPEINHFLYAREIKQLTLKDLDLYLIPYD